MPLFLVIQTSCISDFDFKHLVIAFIFVQYFNGNLCNGKVTLNLASHYSRVFVSFYKFVTFDFFFVFVVIALSLFLD